MITFPAAVRLAALLAGGLSLAAAARDDAWQPREDNVLWRAECSACHLAFPPALLAPQDWASIMSRLDKHFGAEASLDPKVRDEIAAYLVRTGAGSASDDRDELPRITLSNWFFTKHRSAIRMWRKGQVKSLADCGACHTGPDIEKMKGG
jgi:hypothetical protein